MNENVIDEKPHSKNVQGRIVCKSMGFRQKGDRGVSFFSSKKGSNVKEELCVR
ncbi:MAG: hypothetical protein Q4C63_09110 [Eubacteriales bacterium]|nr:hypothetical protein [Eubacteriales bacterium]